MTHQHGGARPGAGRKPKDKVAPKPAENPLAFLLKVMNDPDQAPALRVRAAVAAAQYTHIKKGDGGKKEEQADAAQKVSAGRFSPASPPKLVVDNTR